MFATFIFFLLSIQSVFGSVGTNPNDYTKKIMLSRFNEVKNVLSDAAMKNDFDLETLTAIASIESGLVNNIKNPKSDATGMFQHRQKTWKYELSMYHKDLGLSPNASRKDLKATALVATASLKQTQQFLIEKSHLTPKTIKTGDLYMSHFLGQYGALKVLKAKPNTPISELVKVTSANYRMFYKKDGSLRTAREFRDYMDYLVSNEKKFYRSAIKQHQVDIALKPITTELANISDNIKNMTRWINNKSIIVIIS